MLWENLRSEEFRDAIEQCNGVCVIPIGCVEAHGVHLPLGCDALLAKEFATRAAEREPVCVFPPIYFGEKNGAGEHPGTIIFPLTLIWEILEQCCKEIARNGFRKILIYDTHGGNTSMLDAFVRHYLRNKPDHLVCHYFHGLPDLRDILAAPEQYSYLTGEDRQILQDFVDQKKAGGHGCFIETGCLYDICPELIRLDRIDAVSGKSTGTFDGFIRRGINTPFNWQGNYPNSYTADIHYGMNERIARAIGERSVEITAEVFRFLREETDSEKFLRQWHAKQ